MPEPEKKNHSWIIVAALAAIAYFFLAARPLGKEFTMSPRWATPLEAVSPGDRAAKDVRPFSLSGRFGYYGQDGELLLSSVSADSVAISKDLYAEYGVRGTKPVFRRPDGKEAFSLGEAGAPAFVSDRLFLVSPDNASLAEYSLTGGRLWTRDAGSLITCFDANREYSVAGGLDGKLALIGLGGGLAYSFSPGGSRLSVILGCALSPDSSMIAVVSGIDRQRFLLLERRGDGYRVAYHAYLPSDFRRRVLVDFSDDGRYAMYEGDGTLSIMDVRTHETRSLPAAGKILAARSGPIPGTFLVLTDEGAVNRLKAVRGVDTVVADVSFPRADAFLDCLGGSAFLGCGDRIARIDMGEI